MTTGCSHSPVHRYHSQRVVSSECVGTREHAGIKVIIITSQIFQELNQYYKSVLIVCSIVITVYTYSL